MEARDLIEGETYRHKDHPNYCRFKVLKIVEDADPNNTIVKCQFITPKDANFGLVDHFKLSDLVRDEDFPEEL